MLTFWRLADMLDESEEAYENAPERSIRAKYGGLCITPLSSLISPIRLAATSLDKVIRFPSPVLRQVDFLQKPEGSKWRARPIQQLA